MRCQNAPMWVSPSTSPDSSISRGSPSKNPIMMYTMSGSETNMCDRISTHSEPTSRRLLKM